MDQSSAWETQVPLVPRVHKSTLEAAGIGHHCGRKPFSAVTTLFSTPDGALFEALESGEKSCTRFSAEIQTLKISTFVKEIKHPRGMAAGVRGTSPGGFPVKCGSLMDLGLLEAS